MTRKTLLLFICFVFFLTVSAGFVYAGNSIFYDAMSGTNYWTYLFGITHNRTDGIMYLEDSSATASQGAIIELSTEANQTITVSVDIVITGSSGFHAIIQSNDGTDVMNNQFELFNESGNFSCENEHITYITNLSIVKGASYRIKVVLDQAAWLWDFYVNDTLLCTDMAPLSNTTLAQLIFGGGATAAKFAIQYDNLNITGNYTITSFPITFITQITQNTGASFENAAAMEAQSFNLTTANTLYNISLYLSNTGPLTDQTFAVEILDAANTTVCEPFNISTNDIGGAGWYTLTSNETCAIDGGAQYYLRSVAGGGWKDSSHKLLWYIYTSNIYYEGSRWYYDGSWHPVATQDFAFKFWSDITPAENNTYWCYQETANINTSCGGLSTGAYSYKTELLYINYTKPTSAQTTSLWQIKNGNLSPYNITIPAGCWNNNPLQFRINSSARYTYTSSTQPYCWNATGWQTIGNNTNYTLSGYHPAAGTNRAIDGDWTTAELYNLDTGVWAGQNCGGYTCEMAVIYEEAMWWEIAYAPNITLGDDNIFDDDNYSTGNQYSNQTIRINYTLASDTGITNHLINITRNGVVYYNETTTPINTTYNYLQTLNITTWPAGRYNISITANNTGGGVLQQNYSWYRGNVTTNNPVGVVFGSSVFGLNVTHDSSITLNASFSYNGTTQNVSGSDNGTAMNFVSTVAMPGVASSQPFNWTVNVTQGGGSSYLFVVNNTQTVSPVNLTLYFFDQVTKVALTGVNISVVFVSESNVSTFSTNTSNLTITSISGGEYTIQYTASGYQAATYDFSFFSGVNQSLNLYLLNSTLASWGQVEVRDFDGMLVEGAVVTLHRYWPVSNTEETVGTAVTNNLGVAVLAAQVLEAYYKFLVEVDGVSRYESTVSEVLLLGSDGYWSKQITLSALAGTYPSQSYGFTYSFLPVGILTVGVAYDFTASLTSSFWPVINITWSLYNGSGSLLSTTSSYCPSPCVATIHYTPLVTGPIRGVLAVSTASFTNTYQVMWGVENVTSEGFTLADAMADITNFNAGGFSGWSRFFLSLLVIAMLVLGVTTKTDLLSEPEEVLFFIFALTMLFSYVNWLRLDIPGIPLEGLKQYFISIITGLVAGIAVLRKWGVITSG
jgi:hypothetical protein